MPEQPKTEQIKMPQINTNLSKVLDFLNKNPQITTELSNTPQAKDFLNTIGNILK
jgi:spore coat polysaccharide biosynthesis protein SpsF (cytidylyltransferase family)